MKTLALAISALSFSAQAEAEEFLLFSKDHWSVFYTTEREAPSCVAENSSPDLYFSIDVTSTGVEAWFMSSENRYGPVPQEGVVGLQIDSNTGWETPAYAMNDNVMMHSLSPDFLKEIYVGQKLFIDKDYDGQWDAWFSLNGSAAAMNALLDCSKKLGGWES